MVMDPTIGGRTTELVLRLHHRLGLRGKMSTALATVVKIIVVELLGSRIE